jgi:hypothetical protein
VGAPFIGFLDMIIDDKYSYDFLVHIQLYRTKICERINIGQNWLRNELGSVGDLPQEVRLGSGRSDHHGATRRAHGAPGPCARWKQL